MIYSRKFWYVTCDNCGKTMHTNASTERIARETAYRKGWKYIQRPPAGYYIYCPKCKMKYENGS